MDLVANLMNAQQPLQIIKVPTGQVNGMIVVESEDDSEEYEEFAQNEEQTADYAEEYQKREEELYTEATIFQEEPQVGSMSTVDPNEDLLSSVGRAEMDCFKQEELRGVFSKYNFEKQRTQQLLIDEHRDQILNLVQTNQVVIIQGPTGCGKTTQVPQFILDDCKTNDKPCKIVVTQPRRIAAISVARRVCEERNWALGSICGYQVGLEKELGGDTLLGYVTTGVLLQKLIKQKNLHEYTHIIVDEVHERNQDMDFLLLILRRFLNTNSPTTRVILMSATFDTEEFAQYFKNFHHVQMIPAPVIYVAKHGSRFNIQTFYADQLALIAQVPTFDVSEPKIDPVLYRLFVVLIRAFDKLDPTDLMTNKHRIGNVLVFLPGILEIEEAHDRLSRWMEMNENTNEIKWQILPLHSSITIEEQRRVFQAPPPGERKIILSTNIAESSITVPDILYVVDFCLTKTVIMDPDTQYQSLKLQWASHVNCIQRAGRVGRVADGRVYRLVPRNFFEFNMDKTVQPEILRAPLNQLVLSAKLLELNEPPKAILALAMNPPNLSNIDNTVLYLKEIGGLSMSCNGQKSVTDGDLTFLGRVMAMLPLDVHLSKFILLGHMFSCLEESIIMATGCSLNIFKSPFKERLKAYANRLQWADGSSSDLIAYLNLYKVWQKQKRTQRDAAVESDWCRKNFVSQRTLREWNILVREIKDRLARMHIRPPEGPGHIVLTHMEIPTVIKVVICGAFYPNYFKRSSDGGQVDEREAVKTLGGRDPYNTVYFTGFDSNQPGPLYSKSVKKVLADCATHMQVSFDCSSKVYVQFTSPNHIECVNVNGQEFITAMPGKIRMEVYRAVRLRQLKIPNRIAIMSKQDAWKLAEQQGIDKDCPSSSQLPVIRSALEEPENNESVLEPSVVPSLDIQYVLIYVCERIDAGHFWAHSMIENTKVTLYKIDKILNNKKLECCTPKNVTIGALYAAKFQEDKKFYRCKVLSLNPGGKKQSVLVQIIFIDYGNTAIVSLDELYELPDLPEIRKPAQAIECFLSEIQPSIVTNPRALWVEKANTAFDQQTQGKQLYGKVYSVVNGIVHLELYKYDSINRNQNYVFEDSLNAWLTKKGYAQPAEESFLSKENHIKRLQLMENPEQLNVFQKQEDKLAQITQDVEPPSINSCTTTLDLKGPFSPLEMHIYSVINSGFNKQIVIEGNSVNAVLLDTDPQDPHERLIVAAHIGQSPYGTSLSLRHTTAMPNIHGFPMLMSLLYCPTMEPKPTEDGTRIAAVLCGLGAHNNSHRALYAPHDICLSIDTNLTEDDVNKVNELRYWMNMSIQAMEANFEDTISGVEISVCQRELKNKLFGLLKLERRSVERLYIRHSNVWGKALYDADVLQPGDATSMIRSGIWPLHWTIRLNKDAEEQSAVEKHLNELQEVALRMQPMNEIICQICKQKLYSVGEVRLHLASKQHNDAKNLAMTSGIVERNLE